MHSRDEIESSERRTSEPDESYDPVVTSVPREGTYTLQSIFERRERFFVSAIVSVLPSPYLYDIRE